MTVGFIDPGNWATNIAAGSAFGYSLLWVITFSTAVLILWQHMSAHLGIIKRQSLAEAVRAHTGPVASTIYGITAMGACVATALAEILGAAIGLRILFGVQIHLGVIIAAVLTGIILWIQRLQYLEKLIVGFVAAIGFCYLVELYLVRPDWSMTAHHILVPHLNSSNLLVAVGLVGAVVMPHNIYLHSEVIRSRTKDGMTDSETRKVLRYEFLDTMVSMLVGMAINMAMIIVAAAVFFKHGLPVNDLAQASETLRPLVGKLSSMVFGVALLFAGVSSSMTAGLAGGSILRGYLGNENQDQRTLLYRVGVVFTLAAGTLLIFLIHDAFRALVISQVCLSIQLPFTMLPLFLLTKDARVMGVYATGWFEKLEMVLTGVAILVLNGLLVYQTFGGRF